MATEMIHTTVETGDVEREVTLEFELHPAEKRTHMYPGCDAYAELVGATFDDDGADVPSVLIPAERDFEQEAIDQRTDRESAMAEDAADHKREERRERRLCRN